MAEVVTDYVAYWNILRAFHRQPQACRERICDQFFDVGQSDIDNPRVRRRLSAYAARWQAGHTARAVEW